MLNKIKKSKFSFLIICIAILACISVGFGAKYAIKLNDNVLSKSEEFTFLSDYLTDDETIPVYDVYSNAVSFSLFNNDEGLRYTTKDIKYTVTTDNCTLSQESGTLVKDTNDDDTIVLTSNKVQTCLVTVTSTKPYKKTIKAKFNFVSINDYINYTVTDKDYYIILDIFTGNNLEDINIDYSGFLPDTSNELMNSFTSGTSGTISSSNLEKNSHYELFFKKDTATGTYNVTSAQKYNNLIKLES